jgi:hypothetical protein
MELFDWLLVGLLALLGFITVWFFVYTVDTVMP